MKSGGRRQGKKEDEYFTDHGRLEVVSCKYNDLAGKTDYCIFVV